MAGCAPADRLHGHPSWVCSLESDRDEGCGGVGQVTVLETIRPGGSGGSTSAARHGEENRETPDAERRNV